MKRAVPLYLSACATGLALLLTVGCGDDSGPTQNDGGTQSDLVIPEAGADTGSGDSGPTCNLSVVGKNCQGDQDCGVGARCLGTYQDDSTDPPTTGGICTCDCTPDDPNTDLINEDSCGTATDDYVCGELELTGGTTQGFCLKKCTPAFGSNSCDGRITCEPRAGAQAGFFDNTTVCLVAGCQKDADCPVTLAERCKLDGSVTCQTTGATCETLVTGSNDGICVVPGTCDTASGLCKDHSDKAGTFNANAKVGDPCKGDSECAANQTCLVEFTATGDTRPSFRNGYCSVASCSFASTLTAFACPTGSTCNRLFSGGLCQKTCGLGDANGCRGNSADKFGDYECRDYTGLTDGTNSVTDAPTCDWGGNIDCNLAARIVGGQLANPCSLFATDGQNNPTHMRCRHIETGIDLNASGNPATYPDEGYCLDDTASNGAPATDGGTPTPDGGGSVDATTPTPDMGAADATTPAPDAGADQ